MFKRALIVGLIVTSAALAASVAPALAQPFLSVESPAFGTVTNQTHPFISGSTSDSEDTVTVAVSKGGFFYESAEAQPHADGSFSAQLSTHLEDGEYSIEAVQTEGLTGEPGRSAPVTLYVDTQSPVVTLNGIPSPSGNSMPSFSGTASDTTTVTVLVYKGSSASGSVVAETLAAGTGAGWSSGQVGPLPDGTYTAVAEQNSSLGNPPGVSEPSTFTIHAAKPQLTLKGISSPTGDRTPSFGGTASEHTPVTVRVYEGGSASGVPVSQVQASGTGGSWSSGEVPAPLHDGTYTAIAEQESEFGDGPGTSNTISFTVSTPAPSVSLAGVPTPSGTTKPSFSGSASEGTTVSIDVYAGSSAKGELVRIVHAGGTGGAWSSGPVEPPLPEGGYTAVAEQTGAFGNGTGRSGEVHFTVITSAPAVQLTPFKSPSNVRAPSFSGTTNESAKVLVQVLEGGTAVASAEATPSGGKWKTGPVSPELPPGEHSYTVLAAQKSSFGNPDGHSQLPLVLDTLPPTVVIAPIATPSPNREPTFSGTASDVGSVTLVVKGGGTERKLSAGVSGGKWEAKVSPALPSTKATYTATATQASSIGNEAGVAKLQFVVDPLAPTVTMTLLPAQIGTPTPTFTGTASDTTHVHVAICRIPTASCEPEHGDREAESGGGGAWSATVAEPLEDGEYEAVAWQRTGGGALGAAVRQSFTIDTSAPVVTIDAPGAGATVSGSSVSFHGLAGTAPHDLAQVTLELFAGGSASGDPLQTVTVAAPGGAWSATLGGLVPGAYTARVAQADEAGNSGTAAHSFTDIATAAPTAGPVASFTWFPAHPHIGETVTLVSTASDATSPIASYGWNVLGTGFLAGAQRRTATFATPGGHPVSLRVTDGAGLSSVASQQIPVSFPLMRPFPTVRIVTTRSRGRLHLKLLSVEAPAGAKVAVLCIGKGCPVRALSRLAQLPKGKSSGLPVLTFPRLQRALPAGVALEVRVTQPGKIGKYTRFAVRRGRLPLRSDACVSSTEPKAIPCAG